MKRWTIMALAVCAGLGCDKKKPGAVGDGGVAAATPETKPEPGKPEQPAEVKPKYADTAPLWALAPADATFGIVVGDGAGSKALTHVNASLKRLEGKPFAKKPLDQLAQFRKELPVDIFDEAAIKAKGFDPAKGMAIFGGPGEGKPVLAVLPVGDLAALRKTLEMTTEKVGDREIDKAKELVCTTVASRYLCADKIEVIDAAAKAHDSALATAVKALPPDARGDVEGYLDVAKTPDAQQTFSEIKQFGEFATMGGAMRFDATGMNLQLWGKGTMSPLVAMVASAPPPADLANMTGNATTVVRLKIDPKLLLMQAPPSMPIGEIDVRKDLLDKLTGDLQVVTAGKGILAGAIMLKVTDNTTVKKVIATICAEAKKGGELPVSAVVATEDSCSGEVSLAMLKEAIGVELPPFKFHFSVPGNVFLIVFGDLDPASLKGSVADATGSPEAREALAGSQTAVIWSRDLGIDISALPKDLAEKANSQPEFAEGMQMLNWSGAQVYDFSSAVNITSTGVKLNFHVTSFEGDPADAKAAYYAAVDKKLAGDRAGYLSAMADLEKKFPNTLAARRAASERAGSPVLGPVFGVAVGVGAGIAYWAKAVGSALPASVPGFGEPQPGGKAPEAPAAAEEKPPTEEKAAPEAKAEPKPEPGTEAKPEPKPEPSAEAKPEAKPEPAPAAKP